MVTRWRWVADMSPALRCPALWTSGAVGWEDRRGKRGRRRRESCACGGHSSIEHWPHERRNFAVEVRAAEQAAQSQRRPGAVASVFFSIDQQSRAKASYTPAARPRLLYSTPLEVGAGLVAARRQQAELRLRRAHTPVVGVSGAPPIARPWPRPRPLRF